MSDLQIITLNPGHFHAALLQKEMLPGVDRQAHVYAPLGADLLAHLQRIARFNSRAERPTAWDLEVHAGPDYLERFCRERSGQIVVLAGRNCHKIDYLEAALAAGLHVLADKPWIIVPEHLPRLKAVLDRAGSDGLIAYDIMTERHEVTSILQRALVADPAVFGTTLAGSEAEPAVYMESVHFLKKQVAGVPLRRPVWFFDIDQQGEGLSDVGTHLVDLVMWVLFPDQPIDAERDVCILAGKRWPTLLTSADMQMITGEGRAPLEYFCNNQVTYTVRGVHVKLDVIWGLQAEAGGGDTHRAIFRGSRSSVEIRQGMEENYRPELYVFPTAKHGDVAKALTDRIAALQGAYPGVALAEQDERFNIQVPDGYRVGHEAHFNKVARQFLDYVKQPARLATWEKANLLAKYLVTTRGVRLGSAGS